MPLVLNDNLTPLVIETFCGKTVDAAAHQMGDRAVVQQWEKNGQRQQQWYLDRCGAEEYRIIGRLHGRVLDSPDSTPGVQLHVYAWAANDNQRWVIRDAGNGLVYIALAAKPRLVLDVAGVGEANGTPICVWENDGGRHQKFKLVG